MHTYKVTSDARCFIRLDEPKILDGKVDAIGHFEIMTKKGIAIIGKFEFSSYNKILEYHIKDFKIPLLELSRLQEIAFQWLGLKIHKLGYKIQIEKNWFYTLSKRV